MRLHSIGWHLIDINPPEVINRGPKPHRSLGPRPRRSSLQGKGVSCIMNALRHMPDEVSGKKVQMEENTPAVRRATAIPHTVAHGGSWHGGDMGFFGGLSGFGAAAGTPAEREAQNSFRRENTPWTVHDGQFFAKTFGDEEDEKKPRAPQEKSTRE